MAYHLLFLIVLFTFLQNLKINDGGYIFDILSPNKEPKDTMSLSVSYRIAFSSILKLIIKTLYESNKFSCINIAPGPIATDRLKNLVSDLKSLEDRLPMKRIGKVEELSKFVRSIIENEIKYLTGVTINFDGGHSILLIIIGFKNYVQIN